MLCDSNVWLALALSRHRHHRAARDWFGTITAPAAVCFCRATQHTFLRLLTNASVLLPYGNPPLTNRQAWRAYEDLLADDRIVFRARNRLSSRLSGSNWLSGIPLRPRCGWMHTLPVSRSPADTDWWTTDAAFKQFPGLDLHLLK